MHLSINRQVRYGLRAPERSLGTVLLGIFAALQWFSLGRDLLVNLLGDWVTGIAGVLNASSVFVLVAGTIWFARKYGFRIRGLSKVWWFLVAGLVAVNTLRGFSQGLVVYFVIYDLLSFTVILCFVVIGSIPEAFEQVRRIWFWVLFAAILVNILAMADISGLFQDVSTGVRIARETVSYRTQNSLDVVILCAAFAFEYPLWKRLVVASGLALVMLQQVLFQKRLEFAFYLILLVFISWIWLGAKGVLRQKLRNQIVILGATIFALLFAAGLVKSNLIIPQAEALWNRITGQADTNQYSTSFVSYALYDNERFKMVRESFALLEPWELMWGRGMGGGVELHEYNPRVLDSSDRDRFLASYYLEDYGFFGRRGFEVGMATPVLKGGFIFFLVYYLGFAVVITHAAVVRQTFVGRIALGLVVALWAYTLLGGDFALSCVFQMTIAGACLGCCLAAVSRGQRATDGTAPLRGAAPARQSLLRAPRPAPGSL